ncbi:MAG: hypothetical protein HYW86_00430 [Candidatus Roizmanbacteria bacterium]|nr:MAG: hypothetical protein HYW86_00430 [Candidatus Roizmanbacteria bacterium]
MDNFNKVISFVLGLVVVIVILVILAGRFNLKGKFLPLSEDTKKTNISLTPSPKLVAQKGTTQNSGKKEDPFFRSYKGDDVAVTSIPNTGISSLFLPLAASAFGAGIYLRRKK